MASAPVPATGKRLRRFSRRLPRHEEAVVFHAETED